MIETIFSGPLAYACFFFLGLWGGVCAGIHFSSRAFQSNVAEIKELQAKVKKLLKEAAELSETYRQMITREGNLFIERSENKGYTLLGTISKKAPRNE